MKSEEIKRLVAKSENAAVEFKRARGGVPAEFWPSYSSFANTDGGVIILGVREKDGSDGVRVEYHDGSAVEYVAFSNRNITPMAAGKLGVRMRDARV